MILKHAAAITAIAIALTMSSMAAAQALPSESISSYDELKIASMNVRMLPAIASSGWNQSARADLIARDKVVSGQDIVVFQEGFDNPGSERLQANLAKEYPHQTPWVGRSKSGWDQTLGSYGALTPEDGGVSILSRWPITVKKQYIYQDSCGLIEPLSNKGFAYAQISTPAGVVNIIGTHTQAEDSSCRVSPASVRKKQLAELKQFIDAQKFPSNEPLFVVGDLNIIAGTAEEASLYNDLDAVKPEFAGGPSFDYSRNSIAKYFYGEHPAEQLDYLLPIKGHPAPSSWKNVTHPVHSAAWTGGGQTFTDYSDHYPVFGTK
ncbi:sphingomyelin phosphodiesterase [Psychromicrobium lacuslunae]|uniref:sphingomyelin phosphodiesterase n=1 Tax=Psychromicrobium lacuslunae TaxID=1618207 RepID=UPI0006983C2B|nr:sphingomyelin phosphodiesterase [Psychromicrobium lacuslunae]